MIEAPLITSAALQDPLSGASLAASLAGSSGVGRDATDPHRWYLGSWGSVSAALSDPRLCRERPGQPVPDNPGGRHPSPGLVELDQTWAVFRDDPAHGPARRALITALHSQPDSASRAEITAEVTSLVARLRRQGGFDAATELAPVVPALALATLMGVPADLKPEVQQQTLAMLRRDQPYPAFLAARTALVDLLAEALSASHACAAGGVLARLRAALPDAAAARVLSSAIFLLTTGHGGLRDVISSSLWLSATGADEGAIQTWAGGLSAQGEATDPLADALFHEVLRLLPPLRIVDRYVAVAHRCGPAELQRGDRVFLLIGAANRDPARFVQPDRFKPARRPLRGLGFGAGPHACLGQSLAPWLWAMTMQAIFSSGWHCHLTGVARWSNEGDASGLISLPLSGAMHAPQAKGSDG